MKDEPQPEVRGGVRGLPCTVVSVSHYTKTPGGAGELRLKCCPLSTRQAVHPWGCVHPDEGLSPSPVYPLRKETRVSTKATYRLTVVLEEEECLN